MDMTDRMPKGWHSRGYLPHFNAGEIPQMVTFREEGSLPKALVDYWQERLARNPEAPERQAYLKRIEGYLDRGRGSAFMKRDDVAALVQSTLLHFDGDRYSMVAWVIMSNHVHVLLLPREPHDLSSIVHSWKSWSANQANKIIGRDGAFWAPDYFDRFIRDEEHLVRAMEYIERNPVKVGLCGRPEEWRWSSACARAGSPRSQ
jgi:REP element-mobilizing transposase RayT